jgi:hypothetical protein
MTTEKRVFNKLFKEKRSLKKNVNLAVRDDLTMYALNLGELGKTGQKTIDIAINVNNVLDKLTDDVRFYNDYKAITYDDLNSNIELLDDLLIKAENLAEELGVEPKEIDGYVMAVNAVIDAKRIAGDMLQHNLLFDI